MPPRRTPLLFRIIGWALGAALVAVLTVTLPLPADHAFGGSDHPLLAIADLRGHALVLLDPDRPDEARRILLPGGPHELVALPDGRVVASIEQAGLLAVVEIETGEVRAVATGGAPHGLAVAGGVLYVTDREQDLVRRFLVTTWIELDPVPAGHWPHAVVATSAGVAVANAGDSTLSLHGRSVDAARDGCCQCGWPGRDGGCAG